MGSTDSIPQNNTLRLNRENWSSLEPSPALGPGIRGTLRNKMTGEQLDQYELYLSSTEQYYQFMRMVAYRNQNETLVPVAYLNNRTDSEVCTTSYHLSVYIRHVSMRLCDVSVVSVAQGLYLMSRALQGFHLLYQAVGKFKPSNDMLCIDDQGVVKVWLSADLSMEQPEGHTKKLRCPGFAGGPAFEEENQMVQEIISMVEALTSQQKIPLCSGFLKFLAANQKFVLGFTQALEQLHFYAKQINVDIPYVFESVIKAIRQKRGIFESEANSILHLTPKTNQQVVASHIFGNRFKESEVERVQGFHNISMRSHVVSESNTFADKLKHFDYARNHKDSIFMKLQEKALNAGNPGGASSNQPLTEHLISETPSSEIQSQGPNVQSLTLLPRESKSSRSELSKMAGNHNSHAEIGRLNSSRINTKPDITDSYFSRYLQAPRQPRMHRQLSFGSHPQRVPKVTFTYNSTPAQPAQPASNTDLPELQDLPVSPPSTEMLCKKQRHTCMPENQQSAGLEQLRGMTKSSSRQSLLLDAGDGIQERIEEESRSCNRESSRSGGGECQRSYAVDMGKKMIEKSVDACRLAASDTSFVQQSQKQKYPAKEKSQRQQESEQIRLEEAYEMDWVKHLEIDPQIARDLIKYEKSIKSGNKSL